MMKSPPSSWVVPERTIVMATLERSGSYWLSELMAQTGKLGRPGEYFNQGLLGRENPARGATIEDCCAVARERGASENGVVGIKLFPQHFSAIEKDIRFSEWFGTPVWIRLKRRDLLGQAISFVIARQRNAFFADSTPRAEPVYSALEISETIDRFCARDAKWTAYFNRIGLTPLEIVYEDIEADVDTALNGIAEAAGIDLSGFRSQPAKRNKRVRNALNAEWRQRFLEELGDPDVFSVPWRRIRGWLGEKLGKMSNGQSS